MSRVEPKCPVRPGDPCSLCYPGATGPQDCGLVWLVRQDPELVERLNEIRAEQRRESTAR
ncbi:DUF6767 domain-containing protein [Propioniferax innocua]|uniref:Uncharacterized protein n=1 Tax=Propioniferax innocua TaxID=1753 RepID=A0A542ZT15_9ACTN|nr:DUF6767 domain-containing protein [Propioniferax innocua]TQL63504.1 hypothetical protein FB460_1319 [Propioniferax innocua]